MRSPDEEGTGGDESVSSSLGEGFGSSASDLTDGFGEDDFSDDNYSETDFSDDDTDITVEDVDVEEETEADDGGFEFPGDDGDGLSDDEASNVLEEILEDVFGDDGPEVLDEVEPDSPFSLSGSDGGSSLTDLGNELGDGFTQEAFDPGDIPSQDDFDLNRDGQVDQLDLDEVTHLDFDASN